MDAFSQNKLSQQQQQQTTMNLTWWFQPTQPESSSPKYYGPQHAPSRYNWSCYTP